MNLDPTPVAPRKRHIVRNISLGVIATVFVIGGISVVAAAAGSKTPGVKVVDTGAAGIASAGIEPVTTTTAPPTTSPTFTANGNLPAAPLEDSDPVSEVSLTLCSAGEFGYAGAGGFIDNRTSKPSTYMVTVRFVTPNDVQVGTTYATVTDVLPGATAMWSAEFGPKVPAGQAFNCQVADVTRFAS